MVIFSRVDTSIMSRWWWTVDRWLLTSILLIVACGAILTLAASPPVAARLDLGTYHFAIRQFAYLPLALLTMIVVSLMEPVMIRRLATLAFICFIALTISTHFLGAEIKGASRWISFAGFTIQPSEFLKPTFAVVAAWMFSEWRKDNNFPGHYICVALFVMVAALLVTQPDFGMTAVISAVWGMQFFLAGLPVFFVVLVAFVFMSGSMIAYLTVDHVKSRVDRFLDPASGDNYQITRSLEAFQNGGLFGTGPGEGDIKHVLPDAHTDFIFAVAGEEFGLIACLFIIGLFATVVLRGFSRMFREDNLFVLLAVGGLVTQFGLQAVINMASTTHLMPTKGMTLPFISYGGSSLLSLALGMGMLLSLTRRRAGGDL
ncbi:Lipid II flippase FtsW [Candidatus Terasakiella magnetica]|uniref:Probable peptidoglycan glycosyltransferase FtsW n=1 Tax=Candidatus Terasakiella magnetica TaxID=1867952 RepID=A0A1C3RJI0_9PROT|nr:putative lipid II flippase FtsW [Candidatus Terasakiella magnetica]SCA57411.1 Lipid II flippase FtsW [Candidatus Terasakiella magnetica]